MSVVTNQFLIRWVKPVLTLLLLLPALRLSVHGFDYVTQGYSLLLGANPPEALNKETGEWALRILWLSLALTPLSMLLSSPKPILFRRRIGLIAFLYAVLHLTSYVALDQVFDIAAIWADINKRLFILVGLTAFLLLVPLAITSNQRSIKRLGAISWRRLHKLVYPTALLVSLHFIMLRKGFQAEPLIYAGLLALLLGARLIPKRPRKR